MTGMQEVLWSEAAQNIAFVPDVGSFVRICLESETYVCSFSSEFLFSFELLNLFVFSMYALFLPFCPFRSSRARPRHCCLQLYWILFLLDFFFLANGALWQPYERKIGK